MKLARLPRLGDRLALGSRGLRVSPFLLGMIGESPSLVPAAFDAGINFFFVATDLHWPLYEATRRGLELLLERGGDVRERIVVAAVSYGPADTRRQSQRELLAAMPRLGHLDLVVAGSLHSAELIPRVHEMEDALERDRRLGAIGGTFHDRRAAATAHRHALVDFVGARCNPRHPGARADLLPRLDEKSPALLYNFKSADCYLDDDKWRALDLPRKYWRPAASDYYRFALSAPHVDGILGSLRDERQLRELGEALDKGPLDDEEQQYLIDLDRLALGHVALERRRRPRR